MMQKKNKYKMHKDALANAGGCDASARDLEDWGTIPRGYLVLPPPFLSTKTFCSFRGLATCPGVIHG